MSGNIINSTDSNFKADVLDSDIPVLVDFWAAWCGPCKMIAPVLDALSSEYAGKIKIVKVDVDANQQTPSDFGVRGIPALFIFKNGQKVDQHIGAAPRSQLVSFIEKNI